jgi:hypothetical protein
VAVSAMAIYKQLPGIPAACAGCYGRKNTRGNFPRAFYLFIFANSIRIASGNNNSHNKNILFPPLPIEKFNYCGNGAHDQKNYTECGHIK